MAMMRSSFPYYLANAPVEANQDLEVRDKFSGEVVTRVAQADPAAIEQGIAAAEQAEASMAALPAYARQEILAHCVQRFKERREELAMALCIEAGKPITDSRGEVGRLIDTFRIASEEAVRIYGEVLPMDITARAKGYFGMWKRVPIGACSFISPFNFPLNLAAHKIAAAIAMGCPFVMKPASITPIGALIIGEVLAETDLPKGAVNILPCPRALAGPFSEDDRLKLLSFTGSAEVGWQLKANAGKKKVVLELGGNAACIVDDDADLDDAVQRIVFGAFYQSGQSCISVQRIIAHEAVYDGFRETLVAETRKLEAGDPKDESVLVGPLIEEKEAARVEAWVHEAVAQGGRVLCGGGRKGPVMEATVLEHVPRAAQAYCQEVFGPVVLLSKFTDFDAALEEANDTRYGLQAGIFTRDLFKAHRAWDRLKVGGVMINEVPSFRVDHMPYGGTKDSGMGREGVRFAMEDMSEIRLMVIRGVMGDGC
jgi:acyl-CoA reductase-like NAD-dependent aldehyde dehydrogenase